MENDVNSTATVEKLLNINFINETDDGEENTSGKSLYLQALMYVMYIVIAIAAVGGNGIVCFIVMSYQKMRTVTNFFIVNLALGDILMATLCIPFTFVSNLIVMYWPFGATMCPIVTYAQAVSVFISAYTMVAISIDRYIAIVYPLRPRMTKVQAKVTILLVWIVAIVTPLPTAIYSRLHQPKNWTSPDTYVCVEVMDNEQHYYYTVALMVLQYVIPLSALSFTYARIGAIVWGNRAPGEAEDNRDQRLAASKRRMIKMMITVVVIFTLCWMPLNILIAIASKDDSIWRIEGMMYIWFLCHWLAMSHACYNPIIYCWMNVRFREGFRHVFRCLPCIRSFMPNTRLDDDTSLKRCNTYTTSYTSVRTTSIRSDGQRVLKPVLIMKNADQTNECLVLKQRHHHSQMDDDLTSETHI